MAFNANNPEVLVIDKDKTKEEKKTNKPKMWKVIIHNDDYTPMDYVVSILSKYFGHATDVAVNIMLDVHEKGKGIAGVYTYDIAETKAAITNQNARNRNYPLLTTIEPE